MGGWGRGEAKNVCMDWYIDYKHSAAGNGQLESSSPHLNRAPRYGVREWRLKQATCQRVAISVSSFTIITQSFLSKLIGSQRYICSSFGSLFPPFPLPLFHLSPHSAAQQNEVRDDRLPRRCLPAWVIHGNGKVQTGEVCGHDFLLFFLLDAFFLKSLKGLKLPKKSPKCQN